MTGLMKLVLQVHPTAYLDVRHDPAHPGRGRWVIKKPDPAGGPEIFLGCWCKDGAGAWKSAADRLTQGRTGPGRRKRKGNDRCST
jgi:hypothetical protein